MNLFSLLAQTAPQTFFLPRQASNLAVDVDWAWNIILWVTGFFFVVVVGSMTYFVIRYRRRGNASATSTVTHNTPLEIVWTAVPLVLVVVFFYVGFKGFMNYDNPVSNCTVVDVEGRKWGFTFTYPNGGTSDELFVEINKPVKLDLHSVDVLHALYVPVFRVQRNLVPYRHTTLWFEPTISSPEPNPKYNDPGGFNVFCTQYCGDGHSNMHTLVHVLDAKKYAEKMNELANPFKKKVNGETKFVPYAELGAKLYKQMGCATCHTVDGVKNTGPTWKDLWKSEVKFSYPAGHPPLSASASDADWEDYLRKSMTDPGAEIVDGFQNQMTNFASQLTGSDTNVEKQRALTEYIKSLGNQGYKIPFDSQDAIWDADHPTYKDGDLPLHPESLKAQKMRATQPAGASRPAPAQ